MQKIPLMLVAGDQEQADGTVTPRWRHGDKRSGGALDVETLIADLERMVRERKPRPS